MNLVILRFFVILHVALLLVLLVLSKQIPVLVFVLPPASLLYFLNKRRLAMAMTALALTVLTTIVVFPQIFFPLGLIELICIMTPSARKYLAKGSSPAGSPVNAVEVEGTVVEDGNLAEGDALSLSEAKPLVAISPSTGAASSTSSGIKKSAPLVKIREATPSDADRIHSLMLQAFEEYREAVPPSSALEEEAQPIRVALEEQQESAVILEEDDVPVAMARFRYEESAIYFFRLSVLPAKRKRGYAKELIQWIEQKGVSRNKNVSRCKVRQTAQNNIQLYIDRGYEVVGQELVVRPQGTVKAFTMEKPLGPQ